MARSYTTTGVESCSISGGVGAVLRIVATVELHDDEAGLAVASEQAGVLRG